MFSFKCINIDRKSTSKVIIKVFLRSFVYKI